MADEGEVKEFVKENAYLEMITDNNGTEKVKCKLTGHQLPCQLPNIITYTSGKKYQRLLKGLTSKPDLENAVFHLDDYKEYLVPSEKNRSQLYCKITKKSINNIPHHIEQHIKGKRFKRGLKLYQESLENSPNQEEGTFWKPLDSESDNESDHVQLSDSFVEEDDDMEQIEKEEKSDEEELKEENVDNAKEEKPKRQVKPSKKDKLLKKKDTYPSHVKKNTPNTRKRKAKEEKTITKKAKKQMNSKKKN